MDSIYDCKIIIILFRLYALEPRGREKVKLGRNSRYLKFTVTLKSFATVVTIITRGISSVQFVARTNFNKYKQENTYTRSLNKVGTSPSPWFTFRWVFKRAERLNQERHTCNYGFHVCRHLLRSRMIAIVVNYSRGKTTGRT